jgi:hypothetical protein
MLDPFLDEVAIKYATQLNNKTSSTEIHNGHGSFAHTHRKFELHFHHNSLLFLSQTGTEEDCAAVKTYAFTNLYIAIHSLLTQSLGIGITKLYSSFEELCCFLVTLPKKPSLQRVANKCLPGMIFKVLRILNK